MPLPADLPELTLSLRNASLHPSERASAARSIAELADLNATETLLRAVTEDPAPTVRVAAMDALYTLLGTQAEDALRIHRSQPLPADPWLVEVPSHSVAWENDDLRGLYSLLQSDPDPAKRRKAVAALAQLTDVSVGSILARVSLDDDDTSVRYAARRALEEKYPSSYEDILESIDALEDEEEEDLYEADIEEDEADEVIAVPLEPFAQPSSAIQEVKTPLVPWILSGIAFILIILYFLFLR